MSQDPALKDKYDDYFFIGAAVNKETIRTEEKTLRRHFHAITAENEMKFEHLQPRKGSFTFETADAFIEFAEKHGLQVRGHTLVWHNQTSDWLFTDEDGNNVSREVLLERMKQHITTVVSRYRGQIYAWDVVNEAVADEGSALMRDSKWRDIIGDDFIEYAFQYAHEADPDAQLFYNDYNESDPEKSEKIYQLVKNLREKGVPVHGIGLQAHWNLYAPAYEEIRAAIEKYASLGVKLHVTEMDVSMFSWDDRRTEVETPSKEMLHLQAERYDQFFQLFREYQEHIDSVTFWGVTDAYTWLSDFPVKGRKNWPFLLDEQAAPKPAFDRVANFS